MRRGTRRRRMRRRRMRSRRGAYEKDDGNCQKRDLAGIPPTND
jgi:hypothetical protein